MLAISRSVIGLLAVLVTVLEIKYAQADCPLPTKGKNVEVKYPSRSVIRNRWVKEDSVVRFSCSKGFLHARGDKMILCLNGQWKAKGPQGFRSYTHFQCTEKQCPVEDIVNGKMVVTNKHDVTYSCNRGYGLKGFQHAHCREDENGDFYLTSPLPTCELLLKCDRPIAPNLQINGSCCYAGDEVTFLCEQGYTVEGVTSAVCLQTGNWSQPAPYCMRSKQCRNPGTPARSNISGDCCEVGSVLTFDCHDGYELMDEEKGNSVTCLANEKWSEAIPQCKPIGIPACPNIPFQENNLTTDSKLPSDEDVFLDGSEVDLECKDGYYSEAAEMYLLCLSDGTWDVEVPVCKPKDPCSRPLPPSNGHITKLTDNPTQMKFPILYEMVMECDRGYISQTGRYGTRCEGNDVWKNYLNCTRIKCSDPGTPKNGYRNENDFYFNSSVTFSCMSSYELIGSSVRTCQENGRWSGFTTVCDAGESDCVDPGVPVNSKRIGDSFNIGDIVTYSCKKRTTLIGNATRECLDDEDGKYWSGSEIECRGQNEYTDYDEATRVLSETVGSVNRPGLQCTGMACIARTLGNVNKTGVSGTDVFFAFDGSASITEPEFKRAKDFALTVIRQLDISQSDGGVRVAVTIFSKDAEEIAHLNMKTVGEITKAINDMKGNRKGTDITKGLKKIMDFAQRSSRTSPNRKKIAFVLTDGMWNQGGDPTITANQLVDANIYNVEVYAIGIGKPRNDDALMKIVGLNKDRVLILKDYEELVNIAAKAIKRDLDYSACGFERPVSMSDTFKGNRKKTNAGRLGRILGGQDVKRPWPWMAALSKEGKTACGGSIIHQQWILTAAHCFRTEPGTKVVPSDWLVTVGATDLSIDSGWDLRVSDIFLHENYNTDNLDFDAALMKLKVQVPYDLYIRPICLPPKFKDMPKNTGLYSTDNEAMVIGYGHTEVMKFGDDKAKSVDKLQELGLMLQSKDVCQKNVSHGNFMVQPTPQMICAGSGVGGKDACKGDSGGPLMQMTISTSRNNTQDRWFLVGIKSWGIGCGLKGYYGYYSYVAKIREWVENITKVEFENVIPQPIARG